MCVGASAAVRDSSQRRRRSVDANLVNKLLVALKAHNVAAVALVAGCGLAIVALARRRSRLLGRQRASTCSVQATLDGLSDVVVDSPNAAKALAAILRLAIGAKVIPASVVKENAAINADAALRKTLAAALS